MKPELKKLLVLNVVITNLNKIDKAEALELVSALRRSIQFSAKSNEDYAREFAAFLWVGERFLSSNSLSIAPFWNGWITLKGSS